VATQQPRGADIRNTTLAASRQTARLGFFKEVYSELKRVEWPTRQQVVRLSVVVIALTAAVGAALALIDFIFTLLINRLYLGI
jgi:preprotein translocase subunit SecE